VPVGTWNRGLPVKDLDEDELLLLPRRVVAYVFRECRFVMLEVSLLKRLPVSGNVFKDLKIDRSHKLMVISLVKSHLNKQAAQKCRPSVSLNQNLIRGKGSGLAILLHGVRMLNHRLLTPFFVFSGRPGCLRGGQPRLRHSPPLKYA